MLPQLTIYVHDAVTVVPPPSVRNGTIRDFSPAWTADGDQFTHGGSSTVFGITPAIGTFKFKVQLLKGGGVFLEDSGTRTGLLHKIARDTRLYESAPGRGDFGEKPGTRIGR